MPNGCLGPADVVHIDRRDIGIAKTPVKYDGESLLIEPRHIGIIPARPGQDQSISVTTSHELNVRAARFIHLDGPEEHLVAETSGGTTDSLQEPWEKGISIRPIRGAVPYQGNRTCFATGETTGSRVRVVVQTSGCILHTAARLWTNVSVGHLVQDERDRSPRDSSLAGHLTLSDSSCSHTDSESAVTEQRTRNGHRWVTRVTSIQQRRPKVKQSAITLPVCGYKQVRHRGPPGRAVVPRTINSRASSSQLLSELAASINANRRCVPRQPDSKRGCRIVVRFK